MVAYEPVALIREFTLPSFELVYAPNSTSLTKLVSIEPVNDSNEFNLPSVEDVYELNDAVVVYKLKSSMNEDVDTATGYEFELPTHT